MIPVMKMPNEHTSLEDLIALVVECGVRYAVVDASSSPPVITLHCGDNGRAVVATIEQLRALTRLYLLPVHVIRMLEPYLRAA
jgi:hypothetical protein